MHTKVRNLIIVLVLALISLIPFLHLNSFYTKGEPREALVPQAMIETGNWILPQRYGDTFATKPPFMHWFSALLSLPADEVTEWSARFPVALSGFGIILLSFVFFANRAGNKRSLLAALILLTSFEMHRTSMEARVDMPLTFFMIGALYLLYKRFEKGIKGYSVWIVLSLSAAFLIKGPVGIVLPLGIYGLFLLIKGYRFGKVVGEGVKFALLSSVIPALWYLAAYQVGGQSFIDTVYTENFARMTGSEDTGHKGPFYANIIHLLMGFVPWSILLVFSVFNIRKAWTGNGKGFYKTLSDNFKRQPNVMQYTWIAALTIIIFYTIPSSKRSVYLLPSYPFFAILLAQWFGYLIDNRKRVVTVVSFILAFLSVLVMAVSLLSGFGVISLTELAQTLHIDSETSFHLGLLESLFREHHFTGYLFTLIALIACFGVFFYQKQRNYRAMFYAAIAVMYSLNLYLDGYVLPVIKNSMSLKNFALETSGMADGEKLYMPNIDNPRYYVINFYLHNALKSFEKDQPETGYVYVGDKIWEDFQNKVKDQYQLKVVASTPNKFNDVRQVVHFVHFEKIKN
ncbi:MAG: ArnT family glycosyltransferase [Bacteroidales bacterium]